MSSLNIDQQELDSRLERYMATVDFQQDLAELSQDYRCQGLPVPSLEQLKREAAAEARKCLESIMICESRGHLWTERADMENGASTLTCRRCGKTETLYW